MKPSPSWEEQVALLIANGLTVADEDACANFLAANNYQRFHDYLRYFQRPSGSSGLKYWSGTTFEEIRQIYDDDATLRLLLTEPLAQVELLLRSHAARVIAEEFGTEGRYLQADFYADYGGERTVPSLLRDIERSKEPEVLRYTSRGTNQQELRRLPVWAAVEALSFGTLSKCIDRGGYGRLADLVATSLGVAKAGFGSRVKALVYLRNRCAHHNRLWNHSVVDAGATPNNVRYKARRLAGGFEPRSVLDVVASLDDVLVRGRAGSAGSAVLPDLAKEFGVGLVLWQGIADPQNPRDYQG